MKGLRFALVATLALVPELTFAQGSSTTLDQILDTYVRDGEVYYRALRQERGALVDVGEDDPAHGVCSSGTAHHGGTEDTEIHGEPRGSNPE